MWSIRIPHQGIHRGDTRGPGSLTPFTAYSRFGYLVVTAGVDNPGVDFVTLDSSAMSQKKLGPEAGLFVFRASPTTFAFVSCVALIKNARHTSLKRWACRAARSE
jgi:hypothetical protein